MPSYLLNIGNTRIALAEAPVEPFSIAGIRYYLTQEFCGKEGVEALAKILLELSADAISISCVVPELREGLTRCLSNRVCFHFVCVSDFPGVDFSYYDVEHLGADRIANIAALSILEPGKSAMAIDCGTAINTVTLDARKRFCGGVILPGRLTSRRALFANTAQLPKLRPENNKELSPFGANTSDGIASGVDLAITGALLHICRMTSLQPDFSQCAIYLCGGDSQFLGEQLLKTELAPRIHIAPALTLLGLMRKSI